MAVTYRAVEPCVLVKLDNRQTVYVYEGGTAPSNADKADLDRLVKEGYLAKMGEDEPIFGAGSGGSPAGRPAAGIDLGGVTAVRGADNQGRALVVDVDEGRLDGDQETGTRTVAVDVTGGDPNSLAQVAAQQSGDLPRRNASEATWRDYHVAQMEARGTSTEDAENEAAGMSRDEIRALYNK